ncbi:EAL domain-containing protein [Salinarimonas sp.]|uniref:bifunctional diguanylate cyclase/phosphodiesterase n=1 Tax=Salinarimonas sp. TaxID=2766526 RepID=UPI0032D8EBC1
MSTDPLSPHDHHDALCEAEPLTFPGRIQPFGFLLAVEADTDAIAFTSENVVAHLGRAPRDLVGRPLSEVLCSDSLTRLRELLRTERYAPTNFTTVRTPDRTRAFDAVAHRSDGYVIIECLPPADPRDAARAVSDAQRLIQRLRAAPDLATMLEATTDEARALTGFDRAMVYRFDEDMHGEVVAESREPRLEPYLGLHYPASDIPAQARRMYLLQRVRQIPDVRHEPAALVGAPGRSGAVLDLTYAVLRAVSPYHLTYLENMGVRATLAVSLIVDDALWGMLVLHHGVHKDVDCTLRGLVDLIGQTLSALIDIRLATERKAVLAHRASAITAVESELAETDSVARAVTARGDQLLAAMNATGCYAKIGGGVLRLGETPPEAVCRTVMARLAHDETSYAATEETRALDPSLAAWAGCASGAAAIFLPNHPGDGVVWFRPERKRDVSWGGNPNRPMEPDPKTGRLGPRRSFAVWQQTVGGTSTRFDAADAEIAARLRRAFVSTLLRISEERLHWIKNFDALTGLLRREIAEARLRRTVAAVETGVVGVIVVALNRLAPIVERHGARMGDQLLVGASRRLQALLRKGEYLARFGEDSFLFVARRDGADDLRRLGAEILDAFRTPFEEGASSITLAVRAGIAVHPGCPVDTLVATATAAEREAARDKRGRWVLLERPPERAAPTAADYELEIAPALARQEFRSAFQPIVAVADGRARGVEALCRWRSPSLGDVPPSLFIPAAVESGQIFALTVAMLDMALRGAAPEIAAGRIGYVTVNLDLTLLERRSFAAVVLSALHRNGLPPEALVLEVTETAFGSDAAVAALAELRSRGVRIAIDDFGVGHSSLASLSRMPVDLVKIDRGFLACALDGGRGEALFTAILALIRSLGFESVVEGVETEAQHAFVRDLGCEAAQGFLYARPLEADALGPWLIGRGSPA